MKEVSIDYYAGLSGERRGAGGDEIGLVFMDKADLTHLIDSYLEDFQKESSTNASLLQDAMIALGSAESDIDLINWWRDQDLSWVVALKSFMFWLTRNNKIEFDLFESVADAIEPVTKKSWSMPIQLTTGIDNPIFEGGFLSHNSSFGEYDFTPSETGLEVTFEESLSTDNSGLTLDLFLDFLSFALTKLGDGHIGFKQITSRKTVSQETAVVHSTTGPETKTLQDVNFEQIQALLSRLDLGKEEDGLSLTELLHI